MTEEKIRSMLRQRAGGEMPPGYTGQLLERLHQRQRREMLQRSLWQLAVDRIGTFWGEHSTGPAAYGFSLAALLAVGAGVIWFFQPQFSGHGLPAGPTELAATHTDSKAKKPAPAADREASENAASRLAPVETQPVSFGR